MVYSKKLSGAENRKRSNAKSKAQAKIISKTAKFQTYFRCPDKQPNQSMLIYLQNYTRYYFANIMYL